MENVPQGQKQQVMVDQKKMVKIALVVALCVIVLLSGLGALAYGYGSAYDGQVFKGVKINGVAFDGVSLSEAETRLNQLIQQEIGDGFDFSVNGNTIRVGNKEGEKQIVSYDVKNTIAEAYETGRSGHLLQDIVSRVRLIVYPVNVSLRPTVDTSLAQERLDIAVAGYRKLPKNALLRISFDAASTTEPVINIEPEQLGLEIETAEGVERLSEQAKVLRFESIVLETRSSSPRFTVQMLEPLQTEAATMVKRAPFKLEAEKKTWTVSREMLADWIKPEMKEDGSISLGLSAEATDTALKELTKNILQTPKDGVLVLGENNTLKEFVAPIAGALVNATNTVQNIYQGWQAGSSTMVLALDYITPKITGPDAERLGIREILGVGRSNFSGSPTNRRKNMALGVKHMNGVLLAPGEEFSQLKVLGEIDGAHGWFPELVIKGNQTVPEFGGGLCQVGTTSFRMALDSGLKITQRRNHSYRVRYYEPVGTDATIYDPAPDFRFKNDTANHVLITAAIQNGDDMVFTTWGTKDGRVAKQENYKVFGITPAPATRYIETTDLPPGKVKCTETAHAGASASFDYVVTQVDGTEARETFKSYYKPWGAVCLKGVAAISAPATNAEEPVSLTE
jgi:vancomycin resistance protein YoaR